jgi:hypothetical protein
MPDDGVMVRAVAGLRVTSKVTTEKVVAVDAVNWVPAVHRLQLGDVLTDLHDGYI